MKLTSLNTIEEATASSRRELFRFGTALIFIVSIMLFTLGVAPDAQGHTMLVIAAMMGGYMAMNIGANDVANNVGPAVGSKALTLFGAVLIAMIFEAAGALIAGGDVVSTIKKGIINPELIKDQDTFVWLMMGALLAGALWLNLATAVGAPVSTTHSIVGGVLGAGIAAGGWGIANWDRVGAIAASWVISPVLGGLIAAGFLYLIKHSITYKKDMITAAKRHVPLLVGMMIWAFTTYLALKGLKKLIKLDFLTAIGLGFIVAAVSYVILKPVIARAADQLENTKQAINSLFTVPLIGAAALLSFAHGANDVANAVGPLAAISDSITHGGISAKAAIPLWVMMVGAIGIAIGLALYGPKLIRTVGTEITELDKMRSFCVAMAAAITVIIASKLGLPVSSTHIAVGGIFGVGFLREYIKKTHANSIDEIMSHHEGRDHDVVEEFLSDYTHATIDEKRIMLKELKANKTEVDLSKHDRKILNKEFRQQLVKRSALFRIATAWLVTVPASATMAAILFFTIRGIMLP